MSVKITDVAKRAGVSVATVSRVMNGNYPVKEETKKNVLRAIEELNYIPNMQARELTLQKSQTIGVIVPSITNLYFSEVITGIESYLKENNYSLILSCSNNNAEEEKKCVENFISRNTAGIIIADPAKKNVAGRAFSKLGQHVPLVFINGNNASSNVSCVSNDEGSGTEAALDYLIEKHHHDILFVRGKESYSYDIKEEVYVKKMTECGRFNEDNIINVGPGNTQDIVENTTNKVYDVLKDTKCTAVFACNDLMAVGVLNACKKLKIKVPKDMAVMGFDNIVIGKYMEPPLTTVDQNMFLLGTNAAQLLIEKIKYDNKYSKKVILNNSIIKRGTV